MQHKKILQITLCFLCLFLSFINIHAQYTITNEDVDFDTETGTITSYKWPNDAGNSIVIPEKLNGVIVKNIGIGSFMNPYTQSDPSSGLEEVTISSSTKRIEHSAFRFNKISTLNLGTGITYIGKEAFKDNAIVNLTLPNSLAIIDTSAFLGNQIENISFPQNLKEIKASVFSGNNISSLQLPVHIEKIEQDAFAGNNINNITFPESLVFLSGFRDNDFTKLTVPFHVKEIGPFAFSQNPLTELVIEDGVEKIGKCAFYTGTGFSTFSLKSSTVNLNGTIDIPASVKKIDDEAFRGNSNLSNVILHEGLKEIGNGAFKLCGLTDLEIPSSVKIIGTGAFSVNNIASISLPSGLEEIRNGAFSNNDISQITIPGTVNLLGDKAFYGNNLMQNIIIEEGVKEIGSECFAYNQGIESVQLPTTLIHIKKRAFFNTFFANTVSLPTSINDETTFPFSHWVYYDDTPENIDVNNKIETIGDGAMKEKGFLALFLDTSTSIESNSESNLIFTNPINNNFTTNKNTDVKIFSTNGRKIQTFSLKKFQTKDMSALPKGIYIFKFEFDNKVISHKIIKR